MSKSNEKWRNSSIELWEYLIDNINEPIHFSSEIARSFNLLWLSLKYPLYYILEFCERNKFPVITGKIIQKTAYQKYGILKLTGTFRIKRNNKFYFYSDPLFDSIYQDEIKLINNFNWNGIEYIPYGNDYYHLKKHLLIESYKYKFKCN